MRGEQEKLQEALVAINYNLDRNYSLETLASDLRPVAREGTELHAEWWQQRIARQNEIDASIAAKAEFEYLYDKPYADNKKVRVAGPFTVESLSPHRVLGVDENDELIDDLGVPQLGDERDFVQMILENLKVAGVQQAHKDDKVNLTSLVPWPGRFIAAEGRYHEGESESGAEKRAAISLDLNLEQSLGLI